MINPTVKKYFNKFGFSDAVLQVLSDSVVGSLGENPNEEEINGACGNFEGLAKAMQSESDAKVNAAKKGTPAAEEKKGEEGNPAEPGDPGETTDPVLKAIQDLAKKVEGMEKKDAHKTFNQKVIEGLKANHSLSDKQIESIMLGRNFETEDQVNEFLEGQKGLQETIQQELVEKQAGNGYAPPGSKGDVTKASIENDIKSFNEKY